MITRGEKGMDGEEREKKNRVGKNRKKNIIDEITSIIVTIILACGRKEHKGPKCCGNKRKQT